jgi:hypothetical protein
MEGIDFRAAEAFATCYGVNLARVGFDFGFWFWFWF